MASGHCDAENRFDYSFINISSPTDLIHIRNTSNLWITVYCQCPLRGKILGQLKFLKLFPDEPMLLCSTVAEKNVSKNSVGVEKRSQVYSWCCTNPHSEIQRWIHQETYCWEVIARKTSHLELSVLFDRLVVFVAICLFAWPNMRLGQERNWFCFLQNMTSVRKTASVLFRSTLVWRIIDFQFFSCNPKLRLINIHSKKLFNRKRKANGRINSWVYLIANKARFLHTAALSFISLPDQFCPGSWLPMIKSIVPSKSEILSTSNRSLAM